MGVQINGDTGNVIATKGTFSGDVGIGGTLTYEDVTNIDAVGLVTARNGIEIGARPGVAASISVDGNMIVSGISTFGGDLTTTHTIVNTTANNKGLIINATGNDYPSVTGNAARTGADQFLLNIRGLWDDTTVANIILETGSDTTNKDDGVITFRTASAGSPAERMRIASDGKVGIGTDSPSTYKLHLQESTSALARFERTGGAFAKVDIKSGTSSGNSYLTFSDPDASEVGEINYEHGDNSLRFNTNSAERLRITSDGKIGINESTPTCQLQITSGSGGDGTVTFLELNHGGNDTSDAVKLNFARAGGDIGSISLEKVSSNNTTDFIFNTRASNTVSESMRIRGDGNAMLRRNSVTYLVLGTGGDSGFDATISNNMNWIRGNGDNLQLNCADDGYIAFETNGTERMRIHDSLYTSFGTTATYPRNGGSVIEGGVGQLILSRSGTGSEVMVRFERSNATRGNITVSTSTTYNTTSDYRLKENVTNLSDAITRIKKITPRRFNFIDDENKQLVDGFIAHEVSEAVPEAVSGTKDQVATADDVTANNATTVGEPIHQQVDYSKYVPLLTAALQEAVTEIESLKSRLDAAGL